MGIISAESLYPGYSTSQNAISDLGATLPPHSIIKQPSASIFNASMILCGISIIAAAYGLLRSLADRLLAILLSLFGTGVLGVGIFPGNYGDVHAIFAMLAFVAGALSAISAYRVLIPPMRYLSAALGAVSLLDLLLYYLLAESSPFAVFGIGGLERWVAYPILLWVLGFGGYLMSSSN